MRFQSILLFLIVTLSPAASFAAPWGRSTPWAQTGARGGLWVSLSGFATLSGGTANVGFMAAVGLPLDKLLAPPVSHPMPIADPPAPVPAGPKIFVTPALARDLVAAAWRVAGVSGDGRLASLAARAKASAVFPELRLRVMRTQQDGPPPNQPTTSTANPYTGDKTWLEARAVFHLDRLVFSNEEVPIERMRAELLAEKQRISHQALEELAKWQRASVDVVLAPADSADRVDASLRMIEAESALDVMTAGWFSAYLATHEPEPKSP